MPKKKSSTKTVTAKSATTKTAKAAVNQTALSAGTSADQPSAAPLKKKAPTRKSPSGTGAGTTARTKKTAAKKTTRSPAPSPAGALENAACDHEAIEKLAYQKWQEAGQPVSDGREFWEAAERELRG